MNSNFNSKNNSDKSINNNDNGNDNIKSLIILVSNYGVVISKSFSIVNNDLVEVKVASYLDLGWG